MLTQQVLRKCHLDEWMHEKENEWVSDAREDGWDLDNQEHFWSKKRGETPIPQSHPFLLFFFFNFNFLTIYFNWRLLYNIVVVFAIHWHESAMGVHVFPILTLPPLPPHPTPQGHPSAPALSTLYYASNLDWQSISHMIIYMFQCYFLKSSHPCLLLQSPKVCSLHLCLFCCLTYRVIITIFLNSIYICINILYWCFSFWLT